MLTAVRGIGDWSNLAALRLPDTDDVMRLVQVRDWLAGQSFSDLDQHRMGVFGSTTMHWSRLADLGPAAIIALITPFAGSALAERAALILWPGILFLAFVLIGAGCARRLGGHAAVPIAVVLFALAWPAASLFVPGRIDHHGLQLVLLMTALLATLNGSRRRNGFASGLAIATSLAIGMEMAVPIAVLCGWMVFEWIGSAIRTGGRLEGASLGLGLGLAIAMATAPDAWKYAACDGFTAQVAAGAVGVAVAFGTLAAIGRKVQSLKSRAAIAMLVGLMLLGFAAIFAPTCLTDPYGAVDPFVRMHWLSQVEEARGLLAFPMLQIIANGGLALAGLIAGAVFFARRPAPGWILVWMLVASTFLVGLHQVRSMQVAAALAPIMLAPVVATVRARQDWATPLAWLASIGIVYQLPATLMPASEARSRDTSCDVASAIDRLRSLPPSTVLAPIDLGPLLLAQTGHRIIAGPYHRNDAGIAAWIEIERLPVADRPDAARAIGVRYLLECDRDLARLTDLRIGSADDRERL